MAIHTFIYKQCGRIVRVTDVAVSVCSRIALDW